MDSNPDGIAVLDENGVFEFSNARYNEMFFDPGDVPQAGETALNVVRRIIDGDRVFGIDQMDPDHAALNMVIDCFSFVQGAEFGLKDGRVIQVSSSPTRDGRIMMTFRDTRRDRIGERRAAELLSEGFSSADMGMVLWDAALVVQLFNTAWQDLTLPLQIGDDIKGHFSQFIERGMLTVPMGMSAQEYVHETITAIHAKPMQFLLSLEGGRRVQLSTFGIMSGGVMATAVDISRQYDAEARARALLRDAVEALETGVLHFDGELKLLMMNRAVKDMILTGLEPPAPETTLAQIVGILTESGVIPIPENRTRDQVISAIEYDVRSYAKRRRVIWGKGKTYEISTDPTEMGGYLVSIQDLTEIVRADREAREAHELVTTIVDASPTSFVVSKVETGEVVYATVALRERFGDIKNTPSIFLDPEHRETYLKALLSTGTVNDYPLQLRRQDGSIMDGLTSARVIEYGGEKLIVSSTRDITDFLAMQKELEIQRKAALQNEKLSALGELLAGVAHELSNPLSVIVGYSMMLREESLDQPFLKKLDRIAIAADRCVRIVKMFLALARENPAALEVCNISESLSAAVAVSSNGLESSGAQLELEVPDDLPPILADPDHITQVFSNLIVNAGHAVSDLRHDAQITVRALCEPDGQHVIIEVQDNGAGVPESIQNRIFEPFFTTKEVGKGTGVGLAFSHRVISAHKGTLRLETPAQGGALFRVRLPVTRSKEDLTHRSDLQNTVPKYAPHILVLDDEHAVSEVLRDVLSQAGYRVDNFDNGSDALERCGEQSYHAILCDMRMPDMDGEQFFQTLSDRYPVLADRVIFLTGDTMNPAITAFLQECGRPCLEKPIMPSELLEQLRTCIAQETL